MNVNISFMNVPLEHQGLSKDGKSLDLEKFYNCKLKDMMYLTAEPLYQNINLEFRKLKDLVKSDYRQYSPFIFQNNTKLGENWDNSKQDLLIFDVDDGLTIAEAKEQFKAYTYLIATTKSHQVEKKGVICDRFRIIMPAKNIPRGDAYFDMMRILEDRFEFIDKQVNTKTGAFLGNFDCKYYYNYGMIFDCAPVLRMVKPREEPKAQKPTYQKQRAFGSQDQLPVDEVKTRLTREIVADIISDCGYEVNRQFKFKYRLDEKTPSASISPQLLVKDFGSDLSTDVIGFVQETKGVDFKTALEIVGGYVNVQIS